MRPNRRRARSRLRPSLAAALLAALQTAIVYAAASASPPAAPPAHEPIEGKWSGTAGTPLDRVPIGLEISRDEHGALAFYLTLFSYYRSPLPGELVHEGTHWELHGQGLTLDLHGDTLEGTYTGLRLPITLHRTDALPTEPPWPALPAGPGPRWRTSLGGAIYGAAAVREGVVYVGTTGGLFHALDLRDGKRRWAFVAGRPVHGGALATADGVYFACDSGFLFKLDPATGKEIWRYDLGDAQVPRVLEYEVIDFQGGDYDWDRWSPAPVLADGVLYVGSGDGGMHAVDAATGKRRWRFAAAGKVRTEVALDGARVYFGSWDYHVYAVDRTSGLQVWSKDTRAQVTSTPVLLGGTLVIGTRGGLLAGLDPATGEVRWRDFFWGSSVESTPQPADGTRFFIGSSDLRRLSLIDAADGRVLWRADTYGAPLPRPALGGKLVYASNEGLAGDQPRKEGGLVAIDRSSGAIAWRWPMPAWPGAFVNGFVAPPTVADGLVVVGGLDGTVYAFPAE